MGWLLCVLRGEGAIEVYDIVKYVSSSALLLNICSVQVFLFQYVYKTCGWLVPWWMGCYMN